MDSGDNQLDVTLGTKVNDISALNTGTWYHAAIAYSGSTSSKAYTVYINGLPVAAGTGNFGFATVTIGNGSSTTSSDNQKAFAGRIDDVRFYNLALTAEEVREVTNMARRIAAILLLQTALDANYRAVIADTYPWPRG